MSAAGITYSRHVQLSLGSSQQTGSPVGVLLHCTYRDVYGPVLSEIDVGVFVRAHLHRSQGPHILPSRATGIPSWASEGSGVHSSVTTRLRSICSELLPADLAITSIWPAKLSATNRLAIRRIH